MKNKLLTIFILLAVVLFVASCTSQKFGCPGNPQASGKYRG